MDIHYTEGVIMARIQKFVVVALTIGTLYHTIHIYFQNIISI
jgi:hypothetical protein